MVPPAPYHQAAARPCWYTVVLLCRSVADHVQAETIPAQIKPGFKDLDAVANSTASDTSKRLYLLCSQVNATRIDMSDKETRDDQLTHRDRKCGPEFLEWGSSAGMVTYPSPTTGKSGQLHANEKFIGMTHPRSHTLSLDPGSWVP